MAMRRYLVEFLISSFSFSVRLMTCAKVSTSVILFLTCHFQSVHCFGLTFFHNGMSLYFLIGQAPYPGCP